MLGEVLFFNLETSADYLDAVSTDFQVIEEKMCRPVTRICFGDLHLHDLRDWRIQTWPEYEVFTPLFSQLTKSCWPHCGKLQVVMMYPLTCRPSIWSYKFFK